MNVTLRLLRQLINEEVGVMVSPSSGTTLSTVLMGLAGAMRGGMSTVPDTIDRALVDIKDPVQRDALKKAKGLVQHAQRDVVAAAALVSSTKKRDASV